MNKAESLTSYGRFSILLIAIGALLGADTLMHLSFVHKLWPLLITILGIGFLGIFLRRGRKEAIYLTVGIYLVGFSCLAQWCVFNSWTELTTLWPLFITFLGVAMVFAYFFGEQRRTWLLLGLLLISLSAVFFFVFSVNPNLWWSVFVLAGLSVLIAERAK